MYDASNPRTPPASAAEPRFGPQPPPDSEDSPQTPAGQLNKQHSVRSSLSSKDKIEHSSQESPVLSVSEGDADTSSSFAPESPSLPPPPHAFNPYYHYYHHPKIPLPDTGPEVPEERSEPQAPYFPPHYSFYFPYRTGGEAEDAAPLHLDMAAETNASRVHSPPHKDYMDPFISLPNEMINGPEWLKHPLLSEEDVKPVLDDTKRPSAPSSPPEPDPGNVPPPYPHHLDPYYHYYYEPVKKPLDEHQTTSADVQDPVNPHDLHHLHHQPNVAPHNQDPPPAGSQLLSENSRKDLLPHGDSGYVGSPQPQYAPPHSFYPYVAQQPPYDALGRRVGEEGKRLHDKMLF